MARFSVRLVPRFIVLSKPYFSSAEKWSAWGLLFLLIVLMLTNTGLNVMLNTQTGEFSSALADRDAARYWRSIYRSLALIAAAVPIYGFYFFVRDRLANRWRRGMTTDFVDRYFRDTAYYKLIHSADIDNPDQRIAEDINSFTQKSLYFLLIFAEALLQLIAFCGVLWLISHVLVYFIVVYAIIGTAVTSLVFGRPLVGLNFFQLRREADLRFSLVRVRENAESIAFYRGEARESQYVMERFTGVYQNFNKLVNWQFFLNVFQYAYITLIVVVPGMILAPRVMSGDLEIGYVVQATGAFTQIFSALNVVVNKFDVLSYFGAGIGRLDRFSKALDVPTESHSEHSRIETIENVPVSADHLKVVTPDFKRTLIADLSMTLDQGHGLLIVGPSGGGKSSLLRVFAGLWNAGSGRIVRPKLEEMLFLPQRPYMIIGNLREQLIYPSDRSDVTNEELQHALEEVNLPNLIEQCGGLDVVADWGKTLSLGEQQRLACARALIAKRAFVILDEATSALDESNEDHLYQILRQANVTIISVSHRPRVAKFHSHVLILSDQETCELVSSEDYLATLDEPVGGGK